MKFKWLVLTMLCTLSSCQTSGEYPTYIFRGIELGATVEGILAKHENCIVLRYGSDVVVPIWPQGTRFTDAGVTLPEANGMTNMHFKERVRLIGGHNPDLASLKVTNKVERCGGRGFLVNRGWSIPT